jgi:hypothetical protein
MSQWQKLGLGMAFLALACVPGWTQGEPSQALPVPSLALFQMSAEAADIAGPTEVPFQLTRHFGLILVKADVNDRPATLVIDTGSSHTILSTKLLQVHLPTLQQADDAGKGSGWVGRAGWAKATMKLGGTVWRDRDFLVMDVLPDVSDAAGHKVDGILGQDVLKNFNSVDIDFRHKRLSLAR